MSLRSLLSLGLLAGASLAAPGKRQATTTTATNTEPTTTLTATATAKSPGLNDAAKAAGKLFFGTAADIPGTGEAQDPFYLKEFNNKHDFGEATPVRDLGRRLQTCLSRRKYANVPSIRESPLRRGFSGRKHVV